MNLVTSTLARVERCYDAIPRVFGARVEEIGPFALFVRDGPGWPFYARPRPGAGSFSPQWVATVRARQRELGIPEAFEWVDDLAPDLRPAAEQAGLDVKLAPLMVLDHARLPAAGGGGAFTVRVLDPDAPDFADLAAMAQTVAHLGFAAGGTEVGPVGTAERDAAAHPVDPEGLRQMVSDIRAGHRAHAVVWTETEGVLASGALQSADGATEVVGVATLPSARRRGLGAAVSAVLARHALDTGADLVFLSASDESVARVYAGVGFVRIGTACIAGP